MLDLRRGSENVQMKKRIDNSIDMDATEVKKHRSSNSLSSNGAVPNG